MLRYSWLLLFLSSGFVWADPVALSPTEGIGTTSAENIFIDALLHESLSEDFPSVVVAPSARILLKPKLIKVESRYVFFLEKTQDEKRLLARRLTAEDSKEFERVVRRVLRAVMKGSLPRAEVTPGNLTAGEANRAATYQRTVTHLFVGFGPQAALAGFKSKRSLMSAWTLGMSWQVAENFRVGAYYDRGSVLGGHGHLSQLGFLTQYYLKSAEVSPFLHAALGYGWGSDGELLYSRWSETTTNQSGFAFEAGIGLALFRMSSVQMQMLLRSAVFLGERSSLATTGLQLTLHLPLF